MSRLLGIAVLLAALLGPAGAARAADVGVDVRFAQFAPRTVEALPGDTVTWRNVSERTHTVTADAGAFASGDLVAGASFTQAVGAAATITYHCTIHPAMTGEIDVRPVTLDPLPAAAVPSGTPVTFSGRTADPGSTVAVKDGRGAIAAGTTASADGGWRVTIPAVASGAFHAETPAGTSVSRRLLVADRRVIVHATHDGVSVGVVPALPYGHLIVQEDLADRFGWWVVRRVRLDYLSHARIALARPARVRVALVAADGWTRLVTSRVIVLGRPHRTPQPMRGMHH